MSDPMTESVVVTYLELADPGGLRPPLREPQHGFELRRVLDPQASRWFYESIGAEWSWTERVRWSDAQWAAWASQVETWVATVDGERAGYAELRPADGSVEIAYFGLLRPFHGLGIGGHLLTHAIRRCFELGERAWVHTCTLDGPHALANYRARGMRIFRREAVVRAA
jgi:GNAT superfamily N-acetyltransferase